VYGREVGRGIADDVPGEADVADREDIPLVDVDGDIDILLVRGDRDLGRLDLEVDVATVEVEGAQGLQVTGSLGLE
jgi:hypothetical protein